MDSKITADSIANQLGSGYWQVGGKHFFNKADCLRYATDIKNYDVTYHFFDELYSNLKTAAEPTQTLDELYLERAKQIRDQYGYVMLAVSGGSDSVNMMDTFLKNGIKVDEIVAYYPVKAIEKLIYDFDDNTSSKNHMFEYTRALSPKLAEVMISNPEIKITILDFTELSVEVVETGNLNRFHYSGMSLHPATAGPSMVFSHLQKVNHPNAVCVIGVDKPRLFYNSIIGKFGFFFIDLQNFWPTAAKTHSDSKLNIELFYYTNKLPEIVQKQYFIVRRVMKSIMKNNQQGLYASLRRDHPTKTHIDLFNMQDSFFEHLLYSGHRPVFQASKPSSLFYIEESDWFYASDLTTTRAKEFYDGQILEFINGIDNRFITFKNNKPSMFNHLRSEPIFFPDND